MLTGYFNAKTFLSYELWLVDDMEYFF